MRFTRQVAPRLFLAAVIGDCVQFWYCVVDDARIGESTGNRSMISSFCRMHAGSWPCVIAVAFCAIQSLSGGVSGTRRRLLSLVSSNTGLQYLGCLYPLLFVVTMH